MSAADNVRALVSGAPRDKRLTRLLMVLQAFLDDSGGNEQSTTFVLAGFVAPYEQWAKFADEWKVVLDKPPALDYFKMKEAEGLSGEFALKKGWDASLRDQRLSDLIDVIRKYAIASIHASIRNDHFEQYLKSLPTPGRNLSTDSPYTMLVMNIMVAYTMYAAMHNFREPCDFVFDEQIGFSSEILEWWPRIWWPKSRANLRSFLGSQPIWRDDKTFLPLQAADLYAWQLRRNFEDNKVLYMPMRRALQRLKMIPEITRSFGEPEIIRLRKHLIRMGESFKEANPTVPMIHALADRAARKKERKRRKAAQPSYKPFKI